MKEGLINYNENEISIVGKLIIKVKNIDDFYKSFQIKKAYRKDIKDHHFEAEISSNKLIWTLLGLHSEHLRV